MKMFGPPPSYPSLKIPGVNAPPPIHPQSLSKEIIARWLDVQSVPSQSWNRIDDREESSEHKEYDDDSSSSDNAKQLWGMIESTEESRSDSSYDSKHSNTTIENGMSLEIR